TKNESNLWWRLELKKPHRISTITITNRGDHCWERLHGAEIRIGNSLANGGRDNPKCAAITPLTAVSMKGLCCYGMEGRYVNILIPDSSEYLSSCEVQIFGVPVSEKKNVALHGLVTQSSLWDAYGFAEHAVDGNMDSNLFSSSCSHTQVNYSPWWRLDLKTPHKISTITITNRGDCCEHRLYGAEIHIGNSLDNDGNSSKCGTFTSTIRGDTQTFCCNGMKGRYVTIVIPGRNEFLTLCEVQVFGVPVRQQLTSGEKNVALQGIAKQSSLYHVFGAPEHAIDGNNNSTYSAESCTRTHHEFGPWWRLDLLQPHKISTIRITNRGDCCSEHLKGAEIRIGNSLDNSSKKYPKCGTFRSVTPGATVTFSCKGMVGRYVTIIIPGRREYLTLCEVQVFGVPIQHVKFPIENNVALQGVAVQSSLYHSLGVPEHAIDGNQNSIYRAESCSHTNKDLNPWWRLDLLQPHKISTIDVTNRGDCCEERLQGAEIRIGNSLDNNGNNNPKCGTFTSSIPGDTVSFSCKGMEGRYVTVVIPKRREYLTLCEVQVFGVPV
uniref:Fucolectin tachylectin-4 pentraxin-1 domain-containing protein n=1 Tax=Latimeria chalumnae TaxID=7897 RepID=H3AU98_LATCH